MLRASEGITTMDEQTPATPPTHEVVDELLRDPRVRAQLAAMLAEEIETARPPGTWARMQPWLAGAASALVTVLAFFLPSLQEQWDRWQSRQVIQRYVTLGRSFMDEERYRLAEQSFARAFELSESRRLDIEELRLEARVEQVNADPEWGKRNPQGLTEADFLYLIHLREGPGRDRQRAGALGSYGVFLAGERRLPEAERAMREAARLDTGESSHWIGLGNVLSDLGRAAPAESAYRRAVRLDSANASAHYDLGLLLRQDGRGAEAETELRRAATLDPDDPAALRELARQLELDGHGDEAAAMRRRLAALPPAPAPRDVAPDSEDTETQ